jgi:uroporphyrin-III C-methyltransferase/precorrin-2 dehydrogenase/sirohydrochlorin ferrochelatase
VHEILSHGRAASRGTVYLVGAGPGDPDLLTLRAARLLAHADVVLYDHLVGQGVLALAARGARMICVGKRCGDHSTSQDEINRMLVRMAAAGRTVVRLKGGDPLVFGRGGEELAALARAGVRFEVVPGVSAANGVAASAGIPLTHRDHAHSCLLVTAHLKDGRVDLDWPALARPRQTLVVYMGLGALPALARELVSHGLAPQTPAALIEQGTTRSQRVLAAPIAQLPELAVRSGAKSPALTIVGEVVKLRETLAWYEGSEQAARLPEVA